MRFAMIFTVLSLSLGSMAADAADASNASDAQNWNWDGFLGQLHDLQSIQQLQDLLSLTIGSLATAISPCERVGGTCDTLGSTFCHGATDVAISGLPCRAAAGTPLTGCCWHAPAI
ncbi:hypothetical protein CCMA1212_007433 [Trichoderma ghanense]|uniref:Hydrophobin n=1 Tax=Trichoderma ghanense TaxID=65468 RepID=A0ABY2GYW6_9HYPO